ncbi:hypothetical protein PRUPE_1G351700 [Prunus persica]|uniref:Uncharacterized protein n=1 Tax=Prunus persica TaxID=3760 RepID=A0A251R807_PRUPE|nr:hypothetical protein PRUPE_1G351700 [Prunus persica]
MDGERLGFKLLSSINGKKNRRYLKRIAVRLDWGFFSLSAIKPYSRTALLCSKCIAARLYLGFYLLLFLKRV